MKIEKPTYLIAELEGEIESYIYDFRSQFNPDRTLWPADITIAGSSGIGTISEGQELDFVVAEIEAVLNSYQLRVVVFEGVDRFPNTGIYVLKPFRDQFDVLHEAIKATKIKFNENPWPYNPRCTLCAAPENTGDLESVFSDVPFPSAAEIRCFSLYQPRSNGGSRIHRF